MKRTLSLALLFLFLGTALHAASHYANLMKEGNRYYYAKDYSKALKTYRKAEKIRPKSAAVHQAIGNCEYALGHKVSALKAYERSIKLNPENKKVAQMIKSLRGKKDHETSNTAPVPVARTFKSETSEPIEKPAPPTPKGAETTLPPAPLGLFFNLGGGVAPFLTPDIRMALGALKIGYAFDPSLAAQVEVQELFGYQTDYTTLTHTRVLAEVKWIPARERVEPYFLIGGGLDLAFVSPGALNPGAFDTVSTSDPDITVGVGLETVMGGGFNLFLEPKFNLVLVTGGTNSDFPVDAGVKVDL